MSAEKVKEQVQFECEVKVGDKCLALWTNSGRYYQTEVEVVTVNSKSFGVKIATAIEGYPVGWRINIPNFSNTNRWTWNNRLAPLQVDPYQECLEAGVMPGNLEPEGDICPECGENRPDDERVRAGMKCGFCAY